MLHAWFKREGIDYRYTKNEAGQKVVVKTQNGVEKYWELSQCLKHPKCPVERGTIDNLSFLLDLRHEIEHRSTDRIDDTISARLQACCINFNDAIKKEFGAQYALEARLPIALQRGGSVCLNIFRASDKWFLPLVMLRPGLAAAH